MALSVEWDPAKAAANQRVHGVAFQEAIKVFDDPFAVERIDDRESYGEERVNILGRCKVSCSTSPTPNAARQSASSRHGGQNGMSKTSIVARTRADGTVVQIRDDGSETPFMPAPMRPMTEAEISAAAAADPDARPMTPGEWRDARPVPWVRTLRRALALTQEEFAARYHIPLGTLRDWEQGRSMPDQPARAFLKVIASDPDGVRRALDAQPGG